MLIQGIKVKIGNRLILSDIQFELSRGVNLVLGQNGAGKTTLLRSVIQVLRGTRQGYVPSEFSSPEISVEDVLLAGTRNRLRNYELH
ncbi:AAA family ATPase [Metallosphaera hakonensis]|uniref:AAA family ATPase n=1 Tax=Metallosphaera hakonensis TaxID=79601 RepID=UPI000A79F651|nr:AAA family ATPase [Metallosphaera hakonensis]